MKLEEIYAYLDALSPFASQESWDNSGLLVGSKEDEVDTMCLCLDVDEYVLESVPDGTLIIAHHPLIFKGLKRLDTGCYPASLLKTMLRRNIGLVAMHTNIDKSHLNRYVCEQVFGFEVLSQEEYVCICRFEESFEALSLHVKNVLGVEQLRTVFLEGVVETVAVTTGSGGDLIGRIEASCFLTGDIKYHQAMEAKANNLGLIDIGHFESERYFGEVLAPHLKNFPLKVIMSNSKNPFTII
ncbi:MAG: Nif3-like dinuclear metal center hexameric protein [Campylobacterales bacterium]|nr:Nif3-like dinuclear metal center hexameric protein [Campylobacterales bacterium]